MPGNNEIHYCPAAVRTILEKHLNSEVLVGNVTVNTVTVKHEGGSFTIIVHVTSDKQEVKP